MPKPIHGTRRKNPGMLDADLLTQVDAAAQAHDTTRRAFIERAIRRELSHTRRGKSTPIPDRPALPTPDPESAEPIP